MIDCIVTGITMLIAGGLLGYWLGFQAGFNDGEMAGMNDTASVFQSSMRHLNARIKELEDEAAQRGETA